MARPPISSSFPRHNGGWKNLPLDRFLVTEHGMRTGDDLLAATWLDEEGPVLDA